MGTTTSTTTTTTTTTLVPPVQRPAFYTGAIGTVGYFFGLLLVYIGIYKAQFGAVINNINTGLLLPEYDYIIVGGGSAGAVIAARLSENPLVNVLLLEAGAQQSESSYIPLLVQYAQGTDEDWQLSSKPLVNLARELKNNSVKYAQGKSLGGSSNINYMMYTRGNKRDYDAWEAAGNDGWGWDDVLPYFLKSEGNRNATLVATGLHNDSGPLPIEDLTYKTPMAQLYLDAAKQMGYDTIDVNGPTQTGYTNPQVNLLNASRYGTARAFLVPVRDRPNLHISMLSFVTKVNIDPVTNKTLGVTFTRETLFGLITRTVKAKKEVIVCAGALQTPKLLMLSGVGPAEELQKHNISVIKDLPVGKNLQDHVTLGGITFLIGKPYTFVTGEIFGNALNVLDDYFKNAEGPLTSIGTVEAMGFLNTKYQDPALDHPDVEHIISSGFIGSDGGYVVGPNFGINDTFYNTVWKPCLHYHMFNIFSVLMRPKSRGCVTLNSSNPLDAPIIDPNYYSHPDDMKVMIEGIKLAYNLTKQEALYKIGTIPYPIIFPNCRNFTFGSDEFAECYARDFTATFWHFCGTAKMGPASDPTSVVDNRLRVHGISGLRVCDNSIMPTLVSAHTNAPAIMIGEKAADMIKADWSA